jgi:ATP-dependent Clp protease protease subunit
MSILKDKSSKRERFMNDKDFRFNEEENDKKANAGPDVLVEKMMETRSIILSGEVNKELAERVVRQLILLEARGDEPVKVFIDSPGGDVDAGFAIFDMMRFIKPEVYTIGMGLVASAGALILLAVPADHRVALPNSHYLIHQPLSGIRGVAIEIHAREIEKLRMKLNKLISDETGRDLAKVEVETDRDFWLNAEEAVEYGLVSRVIRSRIDLGI